MDISFDTVMLILHILFFCYWLGTDVGVFYSASQMLRADISTESRLVCAKIMTFLDQAPRVSMAGIFTVGATLGIMRGYIDVPKYWLIPIWVVGVLWVCSVLFLYINEHHPEKIKTVKAIDFNFRLTMIALLTVLSIASLLGAGVTEKNWLALKVLVFAGTMACGVGVRVAMKDFGANYGPMLKGTATPEQVARAQAIMVNAKYFVVSIWGLLVVAAALGAWKPF
ncbi:MAG: hypothetical protein KDE14_10745 [Rhodobacteraceae bacterium]|nr:hypothetical protein [Paracoccaceae bacterium]